ETIRSQSRGPITTDAAIETATDPKRKSQTCPPAAGITGKRSTSLANSWRQSKSRHKKAQLPRPDTLAAGHPKPRARLRIRHRRRALQTPSEPNLKFHLRRSAGVSFNNCPLDKDACPSPFGFEIFKIRIARWTRDSPA